MPADTEHGPFFHGTKAVLGPGDTLRPGHPSNYGAGRPAGWIYFTATLDAAAWGAELARGDGPGHVYEVEPTGPFVDDPNLTDKRFPGNPTRSYRSRHPLRVQRALPDWPAHPPAQVAAMRAHVAALAAQGVEAEDD